MKTKGINSEKPLTKLQLEQQRVAPVLEAFHKIYTDEEAIWKELVRRLIRLNQLFCPNCRGIDFIVRIDKRQVKCRVCKVTKGITADTFMHRARVIPAWLMMMILMDNGIDLSASIAAKILNVSLDTARHIKLSLLAVKKRADNSDKVEISSNHFRALFGKRSSETPRLEHPEKEEDCLFALEQERLAKKLKKEKKAAKERKFEGPKVNSPAPPAELTDKIDQLIYLHLLKAPISQEALIALTNLPSSELSSRLSMMELQGLIKGISGNKFAVIPPEATDEEINTRSTRNRIYCKNKFCKECLSKKRAKNILRMTREVHLKLKEVVQSVSRKYLHLYVFSPQFQLSEVPKSCDQVKTDMSFLDTCLTAGYIGGPAIKSWTTPLTLALPVSSLVARI